MQSFCKIEYVSEKKIFINGKIINISNLTPRLFYSWKLNTVMIIYIYKDEELVESSVCSFFEHTAGDGKKYNVQYYNLDMIISIGYRVNSKQGILFRKWATNILKDYMLKGYAVNQKRLEYEVLSYERNNLS